MKKTQVYLPDEDLAALREVAERTGRSMAELIRQAIREKWLSPGTGVGPVALWDGTPSRTSVDHDSVYDEP